MSPIFYGIECLIYSIIHLLTFHNGLFLRNAFLLINLLNISTFYRKLKHKKIIRCKMFYFNKFTKDNTIHRIIEQIVQIIRSFKTLSIRHFLILEEGDLENIRRSVQLYIQIRVELTTQVVVEGQRQVRTKQDLFQF